LSHIHTAAELNSHKRFLPDIEILYRIIAALTRCTVPDPTFISRAVSL
jgi:hypothetical protein